MKKLLAAIAAAVFVQTAAAQTIVREVPPDPPQQGGGWFLVNYPLIVRDVGYGGGIQIRDRAGLLRVELTSAGDLEFQEGATVDFAGFAPTGGQFRGWIAVRVGGELVVVPGHWPVAGGAQ